MRLPMGGQLTGLRVPVSACVAHVRFLPGMNADVSSQRSGLRERFATHRAHVVSNPRVALLVSC